MAVLVLIVIGTAAGFLATRLMRIEADILTTIAIGIFGALIGGFLLRGVMAMASWGAGFVGAVMGALLLIWLWQRFVNRR